MSNVDMSSRSHKEDAIINLQPPVTATVVERSICLDASTVDIPRLFVEGSFLQDYLSRKIPEIVSPGSSMYSLRQVSQVNLAD